MVNLFFTEHHTCKPKTMELDTMTRVLTALLGLIIASGTLSACQSSSETATTPSAREATTAPSIIPVSKAEFGKQWPVSVEQGELECIDGYDAVLHSGGVTYALNGNARQKAEKGIYHDVEEIWLDNTNIPGAKKDISVLLRPAVDKLCTFQ
jgi:hypothetical protein